VYLGIASLDFYALVLGLTPGIGGLTMQRGHELMDDHNSFRPDRLRRLRLCVCHGRFHRHPDLLLAAVQLRVTRSRDKIEF
jgi:hypothetical protein